MTRSLYRLAALALMSLAVAASSTAWATNPDWIFPVIPGYGGVHPRPHLPERPVPSEDYRVIVDVVSSYAPGETPKAPLESLQRLARIVNLLGYTGVPAKHRHIVAVLDRATLVAALNDDAFRKHYGVANPNLPLLHALKQAGVKVMVCSQAMAGRKLPDSAISPDVEISLSALTDLLIYGHDGYSFMQL